MALFMRDTGRTKKQTAMADLYMLTVMYTSANGKTIKLMDMAPTLIPMVQLMKDSGWKINNTVWELKLGLMALSITETT
jgi:hypothetical protein